MSSKWKASAVRVGSKCPIGGGAVACLGMIYWRDNATARVGAAKTTLGFGRAFLAGEVEGGPAVR